MWDGFIGEPNLVLQRDAASVDAFKAAIRDRFQSNNVHVDIFDRHRPTFEGADCALVQATVYREGRPDDFLEFVNGGWTVRRARRPVFEAAITYEPATGVIEVVANDRESREEMVRLIRARSSGDRVWQKSGAVPANMISMSCSGHLPSRPMPATASNRSGSIICA